ncbi:tripartite tricarboxylate transporter substrate binding protein [Piscinibacter sp. HJYY11]|uniref:Bug family tripartite tricarboxylate transporter substrate binding protein n=1 Tax=Piscinibacter sp. HJYY11 TaxID=2801333 RepID=UPI00191E2614|nr:tripartite tricarboxylate transporter substrate binding protein [Piscinibacter sp. HJYY11]MBL0726529.1 tripartite tricarboxylate transporter substrate binding protein [Piscinibacter sp. HJYY11]
MNAITRRALLALGLSSALAAHASDAWPTKPIKWIVPYQAGTSPDQTVRVVADAMADVLKQTIVVENKPGVAGNLGAQAAARSAADGYTWVYSGSPMSTSMRMYKKPGFDVMKDFIHIGRIGTSDLTIVTAVGSPLKSMRDLIDISKREPGKLSYGTGGIGSPAHMGAELMLSTAGIEAVHVPYKGAAESANAAIGRQVEFTLAITSVVLPHIQSGKLVPLAITSPKRHPRLPNVPTLAEAGVPVELVSMGGLAVPAGTPQPVVKRIGEVLNKVLADPAVKTKLENMGGNITPSTPAEFTEGLRAEIALAERMMKAARLEAQ